MIVPRFVFFVILLHLIVFTKSIKLSSIAKFLTGDRANYTTDESDDSTSISSDSSEESSAESEIDCSDVQSKLARVVTRIMIAVSDIDEVPEVRFFFSSRKQRNRVELHADYDDDDDDDEFRFDSIDFKAERRTVFIVHGFLSNGFKKAILRMEEAFLLWGDVNVFVVDWSGGSRDFNYYEAAVNTKAVGIIMARFLQRLMNATRIAKSPEVPTWGTLHLVGHSLGAHVCANAAKTFNDLQHDWPVDRITGLDPAEPCFRDVHPDFRLDVNDAKFVDVIHTSGTTETTMGFGWEEPLGHVDFYPNGGKMQPGCSKRKRSLLKRLRVPKTPVGIAKCNHRRSCAYFTESLVSTAVGNCTFWAHEWDPREPVAGRVTMKACDGFSCTEMGIRSENHPQRGTFFVSTSKSPPFCIADQK